MHLAVFYMGVMLSIEIRQRSLPLLAIFRVLLQKSVKHVLRRTAASFYDIGSLSSSNRGEQPEVDKDNEASSFSQLETPLEKFLKAKAIKKLWQNELSPCCRQAYLLWL